MMRAGSPLNICQRSKSRCRRFPRTGEDHTDDEGHAFFYCVKTGKSSWTRPGLEEHAVDKGDSDLIDGWTVHAMEDGSGRHFYHNETTNETVWKKPTKMPLPQPATAAV